MKSANFSSVIFDNYDPEKDQVCDNYKNKTKSQKLLVNKKGLLKLESEIAQKMAEEFCDHLTTDPEYRLIFKIKPRFLKKARSIIKTLFIKNATEVFKEDETVLNQIVYDCLNQGIFKKYNKLVEKNKELEQINHLDSPSLIDLQKAKQENRELKEKVAELKKELEDSKEALFLAQANLELNSSNSNLPPSTDLYPPKTDLDFKEDSEEEQSSEKHSNKKKRKIIPNTRKKTGRKKGAQPNHVGKTLTIQRIKELIESGIEVKVLNLGEIKGDSYKKGYLLDLDIKPVITEVRVPLNQPLPQELSGGPTYGMGIRELVVLLSTEGLMGYDRLADILNQLSHNVLGISTGVVYKYADEFFKASLPDYFKIMESLKNVPVLSTDATSFKVNGKKCYVRNHTTSDLVWYFPCFTKKVKEFFENPILNCFHNILLHDHETALYNLVCSHAECNIHSYRYFLKNKMITGHTWTDKMISLFNRYNEKRKNLIAQGKKCFSDEELIAFDKEFNSIIDLGRKENKKEKRPKIKKKECNLLNKTVNFKSENTLFLYNFNVDFTNNASERDLRIVVRKRKMVGSMRSFHGLEIFCVILTLLESSKKQDIPILKTIQRILAQSSKLWAFLFLENIS